MKTKHIFFLVAVFAASFFFGCNKDEMLEPHDPTPDYRDQFEGIYQCRQVNVLKEEITNTYIDTIYDDTIYVEVIVDHNLPGYIRVGEREIPVDSTGIYTEYKYSLKLVNDSLYINRQFGGGGTYTDTDIWGKKQ